MTAPLCECGCGRLAPIAKRTKRSKGYVKGVPVRFVHGHHARGVGNPNWAGGRSMHAEGYPMVKAPGHPRAKAEGSYVFEHILIVERALGHYIPEGAVVHHVDENRANNARGNHVLCEDDAYHVLLHQRTRALDACGHADWRKCRFCKVWEPPTALKLYTNPRSHRTQAFHHDCEVTNQRERRLRRAAA